MANPIGQGIAWVRGHGALATAAGAGAIVVVIAARRAQAPKLMPAPDTGQGSIAAGAAGTDAQAISAAIAQGAGIALQGAGLGLPLAQGGMDLAGEVVGSLAGVAGTLAQSQADVAATIGAVATTVVPPGGVLPLSSPGFLGPPTILPGAGGGTTPAPTVDTFLGYEVGISSAGQVAAYIVSGSCTLSPRTLSFGKASSAPVERGTCGGRTYWRTMAGAYSGVSYVAGLSTGPWYIRKRYRRADGTTYTVAIPATGS